MSFLDKLFNDMCDNRERTFNRLEKEYGNRMNDKQREKFNDARDKFRSDREKINEWRSERSNNEDDD